MTFVYAAITAMILEESNNPVEDKLRVKEQCCQDFLSKFRLPFN